MDISLKAEERKSFKNTKIPFVSKKKLERKFAYFYTETILFERKIFLPLGFLLLERKSNAVQAVIFIWTSIYFSPLSWQHLSLTDIRYLYNGRCEFHQSIPGVHGYAYE